MWFRNKRYTGEEQALRALGSMVLEGMPDGRSRLYVEMTAVTMLSLLLRESNETIEKDEAGDMICAAAREAWSQFRLNERPQWRAFELAVGPDGEFSSALIYPPHFDETAGFRRRALRWGLTHYGERFSRLVQAQPDLLTG